MRKNEFLDTLKQSLNGEISPASIKTNIEYYHQYIGVHSLVDEERIIDALGDPRLIAKTIIESERIAKGKKFSGNQSSENDYYNTDEEASNKQNKANDGRKIFFNNVKWYHKLIMLFVIIIILALVVILGQILFRILFTVGLPIIVILLILSVIRKR